MIESNTPVRDDIV